MKIISRVWPLDDHHEKIPSVVKIAVADGRFEFVGFIIDPFFQINRRFHSRHSEERICYGAQRQTTGVTGRPVSK